MREYRFKVNCRLRGQEKSQTILTNASSDDGAIFCAHALADGLAFCGAGMIEIYVLGPGQRDVGTVSDPTEDDIGWIERRHVLGKEYQGPAI